MMMTTMEMMMVVRIVMISPTPYGMHVLHPIVEECLQDKFPEMEMLSQ